MHFLDRNLELLQKTNPWLMGWFSSQKIDYRDLQQRFFINKQKILDFQVNGHSLLEGLPLEQLYKEWGTVERPQTSATIIIGANIGCGLGYVLTRTPPQHKVIVIEPRPEMLCACLMATDYTPFIEQKKLFFSPPDFKLVRNMLCKMDIQFFFGRIYLRTDVPSLQIGPEYAKWQAWLQDLLLAYEMEMSTLHNMQDTMIGNELENYQEIITNGDISKLKGQASNLQALLFGAGPSLDRIGPRLPRSLPNTLYCAAFQALPALYRLEIRPHLCLALDYTDTLSQVYKNLDPAWCAQTVLIYSSKVHPEVIRNYPGPKLSFWVKGGLSTCVARFLPNCLDMGSNVLVALVTILEFFGLRQMTLLGVDLGYPEQTTHSSGHHQQHRLDPDNPNLLSVTNALGSQVLTSKQYLLAKTELEKKIAHSNLQLLQFHGGGLTLKGAKIITDPTQLIAKLRKTEKTGSNLETFLTLLTASSQVPGLALPPSTGKKLLKEIKTAQQSLGKYFRKHHEEQGAINQQLRMLRARIQNYSLYRPYLFNELLMLSKFIQVKNKYLPKDWPALKNTLLRIQQKIKRIDQTINRPFLFSNQP